jgi:hypothetical protein
VKTWWLLLWICALGDIPFFAYAATPQDINAEQCKEYVENLRHDLGLDKPEFRERTNGQIKSCTKLMNDNLGKKLPNFATHTNKEVADYLTREFSMFNTRQAMEDDYKLKAIVEKWCTQAVSGCLDIYIAKKNGMTKQEQIYELRKFFYGKKSTSIVESIARGTQFICLDEIYKFNENLSDKQAVEKFPAFKNKCISDAEEALLLK